MGEMKIKSSPSRKAFLVFDTLLMILLALICIYPFWYVLCYSFSDTTAASVNPPVIHPAGFTLSNYKEILTLKGFLPGIRDVRAENSGRNRIIRILLFIPCLSFYKR